MIIPASSIRTGTVQPRSAPPEPRSASVHCARTARARRRNGARPHRPARGATPYRETFVTPFSGPVEKVGNVGHVFGPGVRARFPGRENLSLAKPLEGIGRGLVRF